MKHLKNKLSLFVKACLLTIASSVIFNPALADHDHKVSKDVHHPYAIKNGKGKVIGHVTRVTPQREYHKVSSTCVQKGTKWVPTRERVCSGEDRKKIVGFDRNTLLGAVLGGAAGSAVGKGNGRIVATGVGTFIGGHLGSEVGKGQGGRHCEIKPVMVEVDDTKRVKCEENIPIDGFSINFTVDGKSQRIWIPANSRHRQTYR